MKKIIPGVILCMLTLSGCGQNSENSVSKIDEKVKTPSAFVQKEIPSNTIKFSSNNIVSSIEKQIASEKMYTYQLPIANSVITKREVSGFLDGEKTGKISRITVGVATVNEYYYYIKGELVATNIETVAEGEKKIKEMIFQNNKIVSFKNDGVDDLKNPYLLDLENGTVADGMALLDEFVDRKLNAE